ncbi:hypothetical protein [Noviherbaspirillum sedimenti]|uniref:hypothetical protein n=1 Tax=Noviherbaspirillum sedimenti TaxID=2320865 RepID=UPI0013141E9D|nr:hypothetical protein [Noviherbaspirillum sedimenti]
MSLNLIVDTLGENGIVCRQVLNGIFLFDFTGAFMAKSVYAQIAWIDPVPILSFHLH